MWTIAFFGLASGLLLDVLVGLLGSRRNIGFGWAFIISLLFTPLVGIIAVLLSSQLPVGAEPKYGCLGHTFGCLGAIILIAVATIVIFGVLMLIVTPTI